MLSDLMLQDQGEMAAGAFYMLMLVDKLSSETPAGYQKLIVMIYPSVVC